MTRAAITSVVLLVIHAHGATATPQDAETKSLRDITGIEREEGTAATSRVPWLWGAGIVALAIAVAAGWLLRSRHRRKAAQPADWWAKRELARITALDLGAKGKADRHHFLVSNVLRGYIEKRFGLPARRQTTEEFLRGVLEEPCISAEQWKVLDGLLSRCDLGKFTGVHTSPEQCRTLTEQALAFVEHTSGG